MRADGNHAARPANISPQPTMPPAASTAKVRISGASAVIGAIWIGFSALLWSMAGIAALKAVIVLWLPDEPSQS